VVVEELYIMGLAIGPPEYDTPLIVHAYAVKTLQPPAEYLEPIAGRRAKVAKHVGSVDHVELSQRRWAHIAWERPHPASSRPVVEVRGYLVAERGDHKVEA
jgi:hypothetical protein